MSKAQARPSLIARLRLFAVNEPSEQPARLLYEASDRIQQLERDIKALAKAADSYSYRVVEGIKELSSYAHLRPIQNELTRRSNEMQDAIDVAREALKDPA